MFCCYFHNYYSSFFKFVRAICLSSMRFVDRSESGQYTLTNDGLQDLLRTQYSWASTFGIKTEYFNSETDKDVIILPPGIEICQFESNVEQCSLYHRFCNSVYFHWAFLYYCLSNWIKAIESYLCSLSTIIYCVT